MSNLSRRGFFGLSAAALASGAALSIPRLARAATPDTFTLNLVNNSGVDNAFAYVTGTAPGGALTLLRADGSVYTPPSPGAQTPLAEDCAIPLSGGSKQVKVPKLDGGRIYVITGDKLEFFVNPGPNLVSPSFLDSNDANFGKDWGFSEFTFNETQLYANISYVDFVSLPMGLHLTTAGSGEQDVPGLPGGSLDPLADGLRAQGGNWGQLVLTTGDGRVLRALSPQHRADAFADYLGGYIDSVWQKYAGTDLTVDSQNPGLGSFTGRVGGDGMLTFSGGESFAKPSTSDVWSCDSGPFAIPQGASDERKAIVPRLAAALNRTTLLDNPNQPDGEDPANFYTKPETNHYARLVHSKLPDNRGYAFPYDDVSPGPDFSGAVHAGDPDTLTVTVNKLR